MKVAITARVRNADLWEAGQKVGGFPELAKRLKVGYPQVISWLNFRVYPAYKNPKSLYDWEHIEKELLELTGKLLEEIFPAELANLEFRQQEKTRTVIQDIEMVSLTGIKDNLLLPPTADDQIEKQEQTKAITDTLKMLPEREQQVIIMRFGLDGNEIRSLRDIAELWGVTATCIRRIEQRALSLLRHPTKNNALKPFSQATPDDPERSE